MLNIVLFGPPGAGKGTQSGKIIDQYGLVHLSTGDLLRSEIAAGSKLGLEAKRLMDEGILVPDTVVVGMIASRIEAAPDAKGFIFDGFPRTIAQAQALDDMLADKGTSISCMISLIVPEEELRKRLLIRGQETGRSDDNEETITKRIKEYIEKTTPVAGYYESKGKLNSIEGVGSVEDIFSRICSVLSDQRGK
jgi:adenylate kinase